MDKQFTERFASHWVDSWNSHDLSRILSHYADDFEMTSPLILQLTGESSGTLKGIAAIKTYWERALALVPDLHFELLSFCAGVNSIAISYKGARNRVSIEVFHFDSNHKVVRAIAHYAT